MTKFTRPAAADAVSDTSYKSLTNILCGIQFTQAGY